MSVPPEPQPETRQPYEPPTAVFVPLQLAERLMACTVTAGLCGTPAS
jgi:hypothetical protein